MWHHLLQSLDSCLVRSPHANAWPCWLIISRPKEEAARHMLVRVPRQSPMKLVLSVYIGISALLARKTYSRCKRHCCCRSMVLLLLRDRVYHEVCIHTWTLLLYCLDHKAAKFPKGQLKNPKKYTSPLNRVSLSSSTFSSPSSTKLGLCGAAVVWSRRDVFSLLHATC
jgi:hypothetical protein